MKTLHASMNRRQGICQGALLLLQAGATLSVCGQPAQGATKADKRDFFYQDRPKDGKSCSNCKMFSATAAGKGVCALLDGDIVPDGWCMAYTPRA